MQAVLVAQEARSSHLQDFFLLWTVRCLFSPRLQVNGLWFPLPHLPFGPALVPSHRALVTLDSATPKDFLELADFYKNHLQRDAELLGLRMSTYMFGVGPH